MNIAVTYGKGFAPVPARSMRERVDQLETAMLSVPQVDCPVSHFFAPGLAARKIELLAGTVLVGAIHKVEHLAVLAKGRLLLVTDEGTTEVSAGNVIRVRPGMKNAATALEDSAWINFFPTDETDPDRLVEIMTESKADDLIGRSKNAQLSANHAAKKLKE